MSEKPSNPAEQPPPEGPREFQAEFKGTPVHGGDIWGAARHLGVPVDQILDLSASLNPLGPPPGLHEELCASLKLMCHYPDRQNSMLRSHLARSLDLSPGNILPGNGSTAMIRLLARAMSLRTIMLMAPVFGEFSRSLAIAGRHFHYHLLSETNNFEPTIDDLKHLWDDDDPSCVIISNPMTPSGGLWPREVLEWLLAQVSRRRGWFIVDEAFMDFAPEKDRAWSLAKVKEDKHFLVLRSMTKFYCIAGLRLGYLLGHKDTVDGLAPLGEPWSVSTIAQAAGCYCLGQDKYAKDTRHVVPRWRKQQAARLTELGLYVFPSQANYLLVRLPQPGPTAAQVTAACAAQGVLLRDCANFPGCTPYNLRLGVCAPEDQERLFQTLEPALQPA